MTNGNPYFSKPSQVINKEIGEKLMFPTSQKLQVLATENNLQGKIR